MEKKSTRVSKTAKAGLFFSVARFNRKLRTGKYANRIRVDSAVYTTAVLEYLVAEILELSGDEALKINKKRISPRHVMLAVRRDAELDTLLGDVTMPGVGAIESLAVSFQNLDIVEKKKEEMGE